jgi:hypothetical protein
MASYQFLFTDTLKLAASSALAPLRASQRIHRMTTQPLSTILDSLDIGS